MRESITMAIVALVVYFGLGYLQTGTLTAPFAASARNAYATIQAESYDSGSGISKKTTYITSLDRNDWVRFNNVDFGVYGATGAAFRIGVPSNSAGKKVYIRLDSRSATPVGTLTVAATGGSTNFQTQSVAVANTTGIHTVYLTFSENSIGSIDSLIFTKPSVPAAPTGISASSTSTLAPATISLSWADNAADETGFVLERALNSVNFTLLAQLGANVASYADTGVGAGTWSYRVKAYNAGGESAYSNSAAVTLAPPPPPAAPSDLAAALATTTAPADVTLSWTDHAFNEVGFSVERSADGAAFAAIGQVAADTTSFIDAARSQGTWHYRVKATGVSGDSSYSNAVSVLVEPSSAGNPPLSGVGPTITEFTPSGPITVSSGQTVTGLHITSANGPCVFGYAVTNVHIYNNKIGPCGQDPDGNGIFLQEGSSNTTIDHNAFDDVATGVYVQGNSIAADNIVIDHNHFRNARGPFTNGRGEYVQFDRVKGSGHKLLCNVGEQVPLDKAEKEDSISMFASAGSTSSPIEIAYNKIRGGSSINGCGIQTGDQEGGHINVHHNNVVQTGGCGISVSGGHDITMTDNKVYSPQTPISNIGGTVFVWQGGGNQNVQCSNITFARNAISWVCGYADYCGSPGSHNDFWTDGNCGPVIGVETNVLGDEAGLDPDAMWNEEFAACM